MALIGRSSSLELYRSTYPPRLLEVANLVSRDDVQAGSNTETEAWHEGVSKTGPGQIEIGVRADE